MHNESQHDADDPYCAVVVSTGIIERGTYRYLKIGALTRQWGAHEGADVPIIHTFLVSGVIGLEQETKDDVINSLKN